MNDHELQVAKLIEECKDESRTGLALICYKRGFNQGAESRDAEVDELVEALKGLERDLTETAEDRASAEDWNASEVANSTASLIRELLSKYQKQPCEDCGEKGLLSVSKVITENMSIEQVKPCPSCNGKGYRWVNSTPKGSK